MILCGVAGWDYRSWKGTVYPERPGPRFDKLAFLAAYLPVFEINRTYYRPATPLEARGWIDRVADRPGVRFTAKLPEVFVAPGKDWNLTDVKEARAGLDVLHEEGRLAAVLLQFAYSFKRLKSDGAPDESRLEWLRDAVAAFPGLPVFVELRHSSWNVPDFLEELAEKSVGFVNVDQPLLPRDSMPLTSHATTPLGYLRVHGRNYQTWMRGQGRKGAKTAENLERRQSKTTEDRRQEEAEKDARFDYLYGEHELAELADAARAIAGRTGVREVVTIFNNHNLGEAPANALTLQSILDGAEVAVPPDLLRTYPDALKGKARAVPAGELVQIGRQLLLPGQS